MSGRASAGNEYMVAHETASGVYADEGFVDTGQYCYVQDCEMYLVSYTGVLQTIKIGGMAGLAGIDCNRGQPVMLYNDNGGYSGAIRGPVREMILFIGT